LRQGRCGRALLVLAPNIPDPTACSGPRGKPRDRVESSLIRTAKVIDEGLAEIITVREGLTGNIRKASIYRLEPSTKWRAYTRAFYLFLKFGLKKLINP